MYTENMGKFFWANSESGVAKAEIISENECRLTLEDGQVFVLDKEEAAALAVPFGNYGIDPS